MWDDEDDYDEGVFDRARVFLAPEPPAPAPAADGERDHVPDAGNMVAADGEWEEVAAWLDEEAKRCAVQFYDRITSAAALLLRQLPPEGLEAIQYWAGDDGAVIQRTSRAPESWAIRAGSSCMSTTGEWDIEPMPSDRTDEWLANHRWPSAAAAWAALQQARRQEVGQ